ncbi:cold shock domain-containing protein [Kitasatospora sp. NPDC049258]|uniref:cold-shock protein n=1 Tax=Kitasatospora sp. NPDC049258 TaxID=3155394 RepID=UPI00341B8867
MATGTVRSYFPDHGYGYIVPDDGGPELTVYYDSIMGIEDHVLESGQSVEYESTVQEFRAVAERVQPK